MPPEDPQTVAGVVRVDVDQAPVLVGHHLLQAPDSRSGRCE
ncbi:hypothetical protein [Streptomyces sp. NPDC047071]